MSELRAIKLKTPCEKCEYVKVCKYRNNAKHAMERLARAMYGNGPNDDYDWDTMLEHYNVNVTFSCPDYKEHKTNNIRKGEF